MFHPRRKDLAKPEALDLIDRLLVYDHHDRLTAREAMDVILCQSLFCCFEEEHDEATSPGDVQEKESTVSSVMDDLKAKLNL